MHDTVGKTPFVPDQRGEDCLARILEYAEGVVDLIYEPEESAFLRLAKEKGKRVLNGEAMLFFQAYAADCIFTDTERDRKTVVELWKHYREENS